MRSSSSACAIGVAVLGTIFFRALRHASFGQALRHAMWWQEVGMLVAMLVISPLLPRHGPPTAAGRPGAASVAARPPREPAVNPTV